MGKIWVKILHLLVKCKSAYVFQPGSWQVGKRTHGSSFIFASSALLINVVSSYIILAPLGYLSEQYCGNGEEKWWILRPFYDNQFEKKPAPFYILSIDIFRTKQSGFLFDFPVSLGVSMISTQPTKNFSNEFNSFNSNLGDLKVIEKLLADHDVNAPDRKEMVPIVYAVDQGNLSRRNSIQFTYAFYW